MAKKYHYFISFAYANGTAVWGNASCEVFRDEPISCHADAVAIASDLMVINGFESVAILNWKRFEKKGAKQ